MSDELETSYFEEDEFGRPYFRSQRAPTVHGGQHDEAAEPDHRMEKMEVSEPHSNVSYKKRQEQILKSIHGSNEPKSHLPVLMNIHNTNVEILKTLKDIRDIQEFQLVIGQVDSFTINYTGPTLTHIDFVDETQTYGLPIGVIVNTPNRKLQKLKIFNDGPGTIKYGSNVPKSDYKANITLNTGESDDSLSFLFPTVWSLNINVTLGKPTVRIWYVI